MYNKKNFAINLNFDSFGEAYGWPKDFKEDKAYTKGLDRITKLCQKLNVPITIFIIGKDLENKRNFEILQNFSKDNNIEIANHSYSHLFNFGSRNESIIYDEIYKSHELIFKCTNKEPKGFISPTWSVSANVIKNLREFDNKILYKFNRECVNIIKSKKVLSTFKKVKKFFLFPKSKRKMKRFNLLKKKVFIENSGHYLFLDQPAKTYKFIKFYAK